jgi:hypothetical protein
VDRTARLKETWANDIPRILQFVEPQQLKCAADLNRSEYKIFFVARRLNALPEV